MDRKHFREQFCLKEWRSGPGNTSTGQKKKKLRKGNEQQKTLNQIRSVCQCMAFHENKGIFWGELCKNTMGHVTTEGKGVSERAFST